MRILQIISIAKFAKGQNAGGVYGAERSAITLCRGLAQCGHQVCLACQPNAPLLELAQAEPLAGFDVVPVRIGNPRSLRAIWRIARLARQQRAEILVGHDPRASRLAVIVGKFLGIPVVAIAQGLYKAKGYKSATRVVAVSQGVKQHLIGQGILSERIEVIYNGVDLKELVPIANIASAKKNIGMDADALVVGLIGRLSSEKGHDWFFAAASPIAHEIPQARFLIVGDGPRRAELEALVKQHEMAAQTEFVGYQSDILPWMAAVDILVLPSLSHEGLAYVLIEAGALRKPTITSPVGGNAEAVMDGETGLLVPVNDVPALTAALRHLLIDGHERERLGNAAQRRVENLFTVAQMVEKTNFLYQTLSRS